MTAEEVIQRIEAAPRFQKEAGFYLTPRLLGRLGNPQKSFPFVHVAGTNGKGSTCAFLASIFTEAGLKTGCFTSPHLIHFSERIAIGGRPIPEEALARLGSLLFSEAYCSQVSQFDLCLALACLYFQEERVDLAIMETGLGGGLDSTNALGSPLASVITRIGFDHMAILGNTLSAIAAEKAGIIKPGCPVFCAPQEPEAQNVLAAKAAACGASAFVLVQQDDLLAMSQKKLGLTGIHQWENAALAARTARQLLPALAPGIAPEEIPACIDRGLEKTRWPGRMELLSEEPFFLVDGAHNGNGAEALRRSLEYLWPGERFHFLMGVLADKDYMEMVDCLLPLAEDFVTMTPESGRALQAEDLAERIRSRGCPAQVLPDPGKIAGLLERGGKTVAFGSLYFIGGIRERWKS